MTERKDARWIVLKFGGTSVSSATNWQNIRGPPASRRMSTSDSAWRWTTSTRITIDRSASQMWRRPSA